MKIFYILLSPEPVSLNALRYGGAGMVPRFAKEYLNDLENEFWVAGPKGCFENLTENERRDRCITLSSYEIECLKTCCLENIIPSVVNADLIVHNDTKTYLHTDRIRAKQLVWSPGFNEKINPKIEYLLLHSYKYQFAQISNPKTKIWEFFLGAPFGEFEQYPKLDQLLQISNHYPAINSIDVASFALKYQIKAIFAGPIDEQYKHFFNYIDNKTTFYLGEISEEKKVELLKESKVFTSLNTHPISNLSLACKQSLGYGTMIFSSGSGHQKEVIESFYNGFIVKNEYDLYKAWVNRDKIKQIDCYNSVQKYSIKNMIESLKEVFKEVVFSL